MSDSDADSRGGYEDEDDTKESESDYKPGGYHRVAIGDEISHWTIQQKLGWGHFSTVWLGSSAGLVGAVKIQKSAENYREAAEDEIAILRHCLAARDCGECGWGKRFVVELLDSFVHAGPNGEHPVMVFPVLGDNLLALLDGYGGKLRGLPFGLVQDITWQVCAGLAFLHHECQVLHCDVKLENVLISGLSVPLARRLKDMPCVATLQQQQQQQQQQDWEAMEQEQEGWTKVQDHQRECFYSEAELIKRGDLFWEQNFEYKWMVPSSLPILDEDEEEQEVMMWIPKELVEKRCKALGQHRFEFTDEQSAAVVVLESVPNRSSLLTEDSIRRLVRHHQLAELNRLEQAGRKPPADLAKPSATTLWRIVGEQHLEALERHFPVVFLFSRFPLTNHGLCVVGVSKQSLKLDRDCLVKSLAVRRRRCRRLQQPRRFIGQDHVIGRDHLPEITVKICDLGSACWTSKHFSDSIQTRQYRAPEVILETPEYDEHADGWSLACMVFELYTGEFLFDPEGSGDGKRDDDHLALITELLGQPPPPEMQSKRFYAKRAGALKRVGNLRFKPLHQVFRDGFKDLGKEPTKRVSAFLLELLKWAPSQRASTVQLLQHPFLTQFA